MADMKNFYDDLIIINLYKFLFSKSIALILTAHIKPYPYSVEVISTKSKHEFMGKHLHYVNSANFSSNSEVTLLLVHFYIGIR